MDRKQLLYYIFTRSIIIVVVTVGICHDLFVSIDAHDNKKFFFTYIHNIIYTLGARPVRRQQYGSHGDVLRFSGSLPSTRRNNVTNNRLTRARAVRSPSFACLYRIRIRRYVLHVCPDGGGSCKVKRVRGRPRIRAGIFDRYTLARLFTSTTTRRHIGVERSSFDI